MTIHILSRIIAIIVLSLFVNSCGDDCYDETIEKVEWQTDTIYFDKQINSDTLVNFEVISVKKEYYSSYEEIKHSITIKNLNNTFSNKFAVYMEYGYYNEKIRTYDWESSYVSIGPKSSHTFTYWTQAGYNHNFNNDIKILQIPEKVTYTQKYMTIENKLLTEDISVNSCEENIEGLKMKYEAVNKLFHIKNNTVNNEKTETRQY